MVEAPSCYLGVNHAGAACQKNKKDYTIILASSVNFTPITFISIDSLIFFILFKIFFFLLTPLLPPQCLLLVRLRSELDSSTFK